MKRLHRLAAILLAAIPASGQALASPCSDRIEGVSKRVTRQSTEAISASTSGQGAAAKRGGEGVTGTDTDGPGAPPPEKSAEAGKGADAAQQAKVALDEARTADAKGDAGACEAAVARAEDQLRKAP